jgi:hypothetical protein
MRPPGGAVAFIYSYKSHSLAPLPLLTKAPVLSFYSQRAGKQLDLDSALVTPYSELCYIANKVKWYDFLATGKLASLPLRYC